MGLFDILGQGLSKAGGFIQKNPALATSGLLGLASAASASASGAPYNAGQVFADSMRQGQEMALQARDAARTEEMYQDRKKQKEVFGDILELFRQVDSTDLSPEEEQKMFQDGLSQIQKDHQIEPETLARAVQSVKSVSSILDDFKAKAAEKTTSEVLDGIGKGVYNSSDDIIKGLGGKAKYINWDQVRNLGGDRFQPPKDWASMQKEADIKAGATAKAHNMMTTDDIKEFNVYKQSKPDATYEDFLKVKHPGEGGLTLGKYAGISQDVQTSVDKWAKDTFYDEMGNTKDNPATQKPYTNSEIEVAKRNEYQNRMNQNFLTGQGTTGKQTGGSLMSDQNKQRITEIYNYGTQSGISHDEMKQILNETGFENIDEFEKRVKAKAGNYARSTPPEKSFSTNKAAGQTKEVKPPQEDSGTVIKPVQTTQEIDSEVKKYMDANAITIYSQIDPSIKEDIDSELRDMVSGGQADFIGGNFKITAKDVKDAEEMAKAKKKSGFWGGLNLMDSNNNVLGKQLY